MAKVKNNRQFTLQVPKNKAAYQVETRFIDFYDSAENKQQIMREFIYVGTILREISGATQQIMDLERDGTLMRMSLDEKREAISNIIAGNAFSSKSVDESDKPRVSASDLFRHVQ